MTIEHRLPPMRGSAQQEEAVPLDGLGNPVTADGYRAPTDFPRRIFSRQIGAVAVRAECTDGRVALGSEQKYIHARDSITVSAWPVPPSGAGLSPRRNERAASGDETLSPDRQDPG